MRICILIVMTAMLLAGCTHNPSSKGVALDTCTLIGCSPPMQAIINVRRVDGQPPAFEVLVEYEGRSWQCHYQRVEDLHTAFPFEVRNCGDDINVTVSEIRDCDAAESGGQCLRTGKFEEGVRVLGNPQRIKVSLLDAVGVLASREFHPRYKHFYPNGRRCDEGDGCLSSWQVWTVPAPRVAPATHD